MTTGGDIRKIRLTDDRFNADPEALTLRNCADPSILASVDDDDHEEKGEKDEKIFAVEGAETDGKETKKSGKKKAADKRKSKKSSSSSATSPVSDFDRKLKTLSRFEDCLSEESLRSVLSWQREPLKRRRVLCAICPSVISGTYNDLMEHVWQAHGPRVKTEEPVPPKEEKKFTCKVCDENFNLRTELMGHMKSAHGGLKCKVRVNLLPDIERLVSRVIFRRSATTYVLN